ncbi:MAG: hypothetical protein CMJ89_17360 [Planctomycetes bacterium]|jgi:hypothetical protein|nr:hypothetical protein [Planctomycetota bacterium]
MTKELTIHYHRDFDGMVSAAVLTKILRTRFGEVASWRSVNYDQRADWENFQKDERFGIVDFHFHPRAEYWFDHHPTTFLTPELRSQYQPSDRWLWDETSPSCPPLILKHAQDHWGVSPPDRFTEMSHWSNVIDAAMFRDVEQALFGDDPALRISRALTAAPGPDWTDTLVGAMVEGSLEEVARRPDVEKAWQRAARNRDKALRQFAPTVLSTDENVVLYDASSNRIRRERFAAFFHFPKALYSVGIIPTRAGFHVTAGRNPWNIPTTDTNIGAVMEGYGGGGHRAVGGANAPSLDEAKRIACEVAVLLRRGVQASCQ